MGQLRLSRRTEKSHETFLEWNRNLHIEIAAASGNEMMAEITSNLQTRLIRYFYLVISMASYGKELVGEHHAIVRAIRARKPEQARDRATEHVIRTIERTALIKFPSGGHGADIRKGEAYPVRSRSNRASTHREIL